MNNIITKEFDAFSDILDNIYFSYTNLMSRSKTLTTCKRRIFEFKMFMWKQQFEQAIVKILYGECKTCKIDDMSDKIKDYLLKNKLVDCELVDFYFDFHRQFSCSYIKYIENIIHDQSIPVMKKIKLMSDEYLELMNITLIELKGLEVGCSIFCDDEICNRFGCRECQNESNIVRLILVPEYFRFDGVFNKLIRSFSKIKKRDKVILIVDYRNICKRLDYYSWEEQGAYERYQFVKPYFHKVYFYKYGPCVDFGKYHKELLENKQLIPDKETYYNIIDNWRESQGKMRKYTIKKELFKDIID